jgi:hypothetical protein
MRTFAPAALEAELFVQLLGVFPGMLLRRSTLTMPPPSE